MSAGSTSEPLIVDGNDGKPILCLDFDGVLHSYTSGWQGADVIPDPPVQGAVEFLGLAVEHFQVVIISSRSHLPEGREAMRDWLAELVGVYDPTSDSWTVPHWFSSIKWPAEKPPAHVFIDDRAITFRGVWPSVGELLAFRPWNRT